MQSVEGVITLVQEGGGARVTNGGRVVHFVLAAQTTYRPKGSKNEVEAHLPSTLVRWRSARDASLGRKDD
jgi:hypothetical protein